MNQVIIMDIEKCNCGEYLLKITDSEILGGEGRVWYVCPIILCGGDTEGHISKYGELCR